MTSTIKVDNIAPSAGGTEFSLTRGVAKAWVRGDKAAVIGQSLNISSSVDNGTGSYTYNFTAGFDAVTWSGQVTAEAINRIGAIDNSTKAVGSAPIRTTLYNSAAEDRQHGLSIQGDLA